MLFLSYSDAERGDVVVNKGFFYKSDVKKFTDDTLLEYYQAEFYKQFEKGKLLKVVDGKIVYDANSISRLKTSLREISLKDYILLIIGALLGFLLSLGDLS
jgi:hypothetical protein